MLYHVSYQTIENSNFYPRIPKARAKNENSNIKRICFSNSIEGCLTAMPGSGKPLKNMLECSKILPIEPIVHIYSIAEDDSRIADGNIVYSQMVNDYVKDAVANHEIWIIGQEIQCDHKIAKITAANIELVHDIYGFEVYKVNSVHWESLKKLPCKAPEIFFKECGANTREILGCLDELMGQRKLRKIC